MTHETESKIPPMEWYGGIALPEEGIRTILIGTNTFDSLHPDLRERMANWGHSQLSPGQTEFSSREIAQYQEEEGAFVQSVTGFAPEALMQYARELRRIYVGQSMGPFPFPVEWITK